MNILLKKTETHKFLMDIYDFKPDYIIMLHDALYEGLFDDMSEEIAIKFTKKFQDGGYYIGDSSFPDTYQTAKDAIKSVIKNNPWIVVYIINLDAQHIPHKISEHKLPTNPNLIALIQAMNAVRDENDHCTPKQLFDELHRIGFTINNINNSSNNMWNDEIVANMVWEARYFWASRHNAHIEYAEMKKQFDDYFDRNKKALM